MPPFQLRRVITGHDEQGNAIIRSNEILASEELFPTLDNIELWCTDRLPADNDESAYNSGKAGAPGTRAVLRTGILEPGTPLVMHRTETLDYGIVMSGRIRLHLDGGEEVELRAGDVVIQRGTSHAWTVPGPEPCRMLFVLIDAEPVRVGDRALREAIDDVPFGEIMPNQGT